jgi:hypothetical protein
MIVSDDRDADIAALVSFAEADVLWLRGRSA